MPKHIRKHILLFLIAGLFLSCRHSASTEEAVTNEVNTPVTIVPVTYKSISASVSLPAVATFMNKNIIRAVTTGTLEKIFVSQGEAISSGQVLFAIKTREASALENKFKSDTSLNFAGSVKILAHSTGIISAISYQAGDFVQEGDELATISDQKSLVFIMDVPFELDRYISSNRNCTVILPDERKINVTISHKLAEMDMPSQTIRYIVKPSSFIQLPGNLIARVNLVKSTKENALVLPKAAVLGNETETEFWVMKMLNDSTAARVNVTRGLENNEEVEIISPEFQKSDRIVLTGNYGLPDTARITITGEQSR